MPPDATFDPLLHAAEILGVSGLVDDHLLPNDPLRRLQLASAVSGAADGYAMVHASALAADTVLDPIEAVDEIRFHALGMGGEPTRLATMWSIWAVRQVKARLTAIRTKKPTAELEAASSILQAAHAVLSAAVHRVQANSEDAEQCVVEARNGLEGAWKLLAT